MQPRCSEHEITWKNYPEAGIGDFGFESLCLDTIRLIIMNSCQEAKYSLQKENEFFLDISNAIQSCCLVNRKMYVDIHSHRHAQAYLSPYTHIHTYAYTFNVSMLLLLDLLPAYLALCLLKLNLVVNTHKVKKRQAMWDYHWL